MKRRQYLIEMLINNTTIGEEKTISIKWSHKKIVTYLFKLMGYTKMKMKSGTHL